MRPRACWDFPSRVIEILFESLLKLRVTFVDFSLSSTWLVYCKTESSVDNCLKIRQHLLIINVRLLNFGCSNICVVKFNSCKGLKQQCDVKYSLSSIAGYRINSKGHTMLDRPALSIRHTSRRFQMYRIVRFVIRRLFNALKTYHKFPSTIASDSRTKAISGRSAMSVHKRPVINRNADENVNNHGVSNASRGKVRERLPLPSGLCSTFPPSSWCWSQLHHELEKYHNQRALFITLFMLTLFVCLLIRATKLCYDPNWQHRGSPTFRSHPAVLFSFRTLISSFSERSLSVTRENVLFKCTDRHNEMHRRSPALLQSRRENKNSKNNKSGV